MTTIIAYRRAARRLLATAALACAGTAAADETINSSGLTSAACTQKDSDTTQFCEAVASELLDECLAARDRMLGSCLATGKWTDDLELDPRTGAKPDTMGRFAAFLLRVLMTSGDSNGDGALPDDEIGALKARVLGNLASERGAIPLDDLGRAHPIKQ